MSQTLQRFLTLKGYQHIFLEQNGAGHYQITAQLNQVNTSFIIDTGASRTVIDHERATVLGLISEDDSLQAAGLGGREMKTRISHDNLLTIAGMDIPSVVITLLDLSHVNYALESFGDIPVDGVIGLDILHDLKAVIDYGNSVMYFQNPAQNGKAA
ncbi:MAG: retropepsin-like aspartic protease [Bacteroidota bacterium]